jgi:outer membrane protein TolC
LSDNGLQPAFNPAKRGAKEMLKITTHDEPAIRRLQVEGKLTGVSIAELENTWRSERQSPSAKPVEIDLTGVISIDQGGKYLLSRLYNDGACLVAAGAKTKELIAEIANGAPVEPATDSRGRRCWKIATRALVLVALLLIGQDISLLAADSISSPMRLTLKDAVNLSLRQNPQVAIANLDLIESEQNRNIARSGLLPQASLGVSDTLTRGNVQALLGQKIPGFPGHIGPFYVIQAAPQISAPVFDLTLWRKWQASREAVRTTAARQTTARELNAQLVVSQYLGGLRAAAEVKAARSRVDLAQALLNLASDMQKNGVGTGIDTLRAKVEYQNETQRAIVADTQLKTSIYGLARLLNIDPRQPIELADAASFFETPSFPAGGSLERAYAERPEMKAILSQMRVEELRKSAAKDARLPKLSVAGAWSLDGVTPTSMIPVYQYGASLEMPLFTGGRIKAETAVADIELRKLAQSEQDLRNQIALEVKTSLAELQSAQSEVDAANLGVTLAKEGVQQAQDRFRAGVANNIEVITAQDELARANDNQISALYHYNQSRASLARATGQMEALYSK